MEHAKPHEIVNRLFEARDELRTHIAIETALIERISELPEDDYCSTSRECFQMGAGYASLQAKATEQSVESFAYTSSQPLDEILTAFFATQPQNRYLDLEEINRERKMISDAALALMQTGEAPEIHPSIDPFRVAAAAAFAEGYIIVSSMQSLQLTRVGDTAASEYA